MTVKIPSFIRCPLRRVTALIVKEFYQIVRDPSSVLIAFILPLILIFLFGYAISLDTRHTKIGIVLETTNPDMMDFAASFRHSPYFDAVMDTDRHTIEEMLVAGRVRAMIVLPLAFDREEEERSRVAPIQVITDASEPNTANLLANYIQAAWQTWNIQKLKSSGEEYKPPIQVIDRVWYNPASISRFFLLPGSIAIIMTIVGTLLTALVVAREWERGTMEALMSTPITIFEIILGKLVPYFVLGLGAMSVCVLFSVVIFDVPFRGSVLLLLGVSSLFLYAALSLGLLISTISRNQFVASQASLYAAFLPAFLLSGFLFEIKSMPTVIQGLTYVLPARYFVNTLQTLFLAGDVTKLIIVDAVGIISIGSVFVFVILKKTRKRLD